MKDRTAYSRINENDEVTGSTDSGDSPFEEAMIPQAPLVDDIDEDENETKTKRFLKNPLTRSNDNSHEFQRLPSDDEDSLTPTSNSNSNQSKNTESTITYPPTEDNGEEYSSQPGDFEISSADRDNDSSDSPPPNPFKISNDSDENLETNFGDDDNCTPRRFSLLNRANSYTISDDDDDDDDDYETNQFHKYLTPSKSTEPIHEPNFKEDEINDHKLFPTPSTRRSSFDKNVITPMKQMISNLHFEQERSRRRRIERLLSSLPDDDGRSTCHYIASKAVLCLSSAWCDLTDSRGWILLFMISLTIFLVWYILENHPIHRKWILIVSGVTLFTRVGYKPLYWFVWGRRAEMRRKVTLELYDGLNGENGTKGMEIPHNEIDQEHMAENNDSTPKDHVDVKFSTPNSIV